MLMYGFKSYHIATRAILRYVLSNCSDLQDILYTKINSRGLSLPGEPNLRVKRRQ